MEIVEGFGKQILCGKDELGIFSLKTAGTEYYQESRSSHLLLQAPTPKIQCQFKKLLSPLPGED